MVDFMFHEVTWRAVGLAACGWLIAFDASALTVGRARGAVLVGRPLEFTIPVTLDGKGEDAPCASAAPGPVIRAAAPAGRAAPPTPATPARKPQAGEPRARLKLEPLELGPERDPVLRLSSELRTEAATDPQRRLAAAALWKALQKGPDEALQDTLRLQAVERELKSLRDLTQQNASAVARMRKEVESARGRRGMAGGVAGGMVAALALALALALLALLAWLGWRWWGDHRLKRVGRWFEEHGEGRSGAPRAQAAQGLQTQPAAILREGPPAPNAGALAAGVAAGAVAGAAAARAAGAARPPSAMHLAQAPREEFLASRGGITRMVGVQELIDVHDKADFFLSIGEYDQAIALLEAHVHDDVETSALAWMDLLELYHSLGRRTEYERLRGEFRQRFMASVPDFEHFDQPSASLENYERALGRIVALWPSPRVLDVIEESIFRKPGLPGAEPFSLEAYRELVLLYHVAKDMVEAGQGPPTPPTFHDTAVHPLNASERADPSATERDRLMVPPASARLGVDIDVGELPALDFDLDEPTTSPSLAPWPRT